MADLADIAAAAFDAGRAHGYRAALIDVAARVVEVDDAWRPAGRLGHERRVAERVAVFEQCARRIAQELGRPYISHPGGPVEWSTGRPVRKMGVAA